MTDSQDTAADQFGAVAYDSSDAGLAEEALARAGIVTTSVHCIDLICVYTTDRPVPTANLDKLKADARLDSATDVFAEESGVGARRWSMLEYEVTATAADIKTLTKKIKRAAPDATVRQAKNCVGKAKCFQVLFFSDNNAEETKKVKSLVASARGTSGKAEVYESEQACFAAAGLSSEEGRVALMFAGISANTVECARGICCFSTSMPTPSLEPLLSVPGAAVTSVSGTVARPPAKPTAATGGIIEVFTEAVSELKSDQGTVLTSEGDLLTADLESVLGGAGTFEIQCHSGYFCTVAAKMALLSAKADRMRAVLALSAQPFLMTDPKPATGKIATLTFNTRKGRRAAGHAALVTPPRHAVKYLLINSGVDVLDVHCAAYTCSFTVPESTTTLPPIASIVNALTSDVRTQLRELRVESVSPLSEDVEMRGAMQYDAASAFDATDAGAVKLGDAGVVTKAVACSAGGVCTFTTHHIAPNDQLALTRSSTDDAGQESITAASPVCEGGVAYHGEFTTASGARFSQQEASAVILRANLVPTSVACAGNGCSFTTAPCTDNSTVAALFGKLRLSSALVNVAEPVAMDDDFHIRRQVTDSIAAATGVNHDQITILSIGPDGTVKFVVEDGAQRYRFLATYSVPAGTIRKVLADILGVTASGVDMTVDSDNNMMYFYTTVALTKKQIDALATAGVEIVPTGTAADGQPTHYTIERGISADHATKTLVKCAQDGCSALGDLNLNASAASSIKVNRAAEQAASKDGGDTGKASSDDDDGFPVLAVVVPLVLLCIIGLAVAAFLVLNENSKKEVPTNLQVKTIEMQAPTAGFSNPMYHNPGGDDNNDGDLYDDTAAYADTGGYQDVAPRPEDTEGYGNPNGAEGMQDTSGYADVSAAVPTTSPYESGDYDNGDANDSGPDSGSDDGEAYQEMKNADVPNTDVEGDAYAEPDADGDGNGGYLTVGATPAAETENGYMSVAGAADPVDGGAEETFDGFAPPADAEAEATHVDQGAMQNVAQEFSASEEPVAPTTAYADGYEAMAGDTQAGAGASEDYGPDDTYAEPDSGSDLDDDDVEEV